MKNPLISEVNTYLKPLGFKRRSSVWNRNVGLYVDVVDIQKSKSGDEITINAGVLNLKVNEQYGFAKESKFIVEPDCTVRSRIGYLIGDRDIWWSLTEPKLSEIFKDSILKVVLPFLDSMHSDVAMERFLTETEVDKRHYPPPIIYLALLRSELGKKAEACALLTNLRTTASPPWQKTIDELIEKLGWKKFLTS